MILVVGSVNIDLVMTVPALPRPGETVIGGALERHYGGKGANQAVAAARLGAAVRFVGSVGDDEVAADLVDNLAANGCEVGFVTRVAGPSGHALIQVTPEGENTIAVASGANERLELPRGCWDGVTTVVAQLEIPLKTVLHAAKEARRRGARFVLNAAPATPLPELLPYVDVLVVNETEARVLAGESEDAQQALESLRPSVPSVVLTLGAEGAAWATRADSGRVAGRRVPAVDATGAGDTFVGALAVMLDRGSVLADAASYANRAAAFAVQSKGAQTAMPYAQQLEESP